VTAGVTVTAGVRVALVLGGTVATLLLVGGLSSLELDKLRERFFGRLRPSHF
jgi:putative NADH-flavin reductase